MKFFTITTTLLLLLTTSVLSTPLIPFPKPKLSARSTVPQQKPFCVPQKPGTCTLAVRWPSTTNYKKTKHELELYNSHCRLIGNSTVKPLPGDFNLYSELPSVVVGNTAFPSFRYEGTRYNDEMMGLKGMKAQCEMGGGGLGVEGVIYICPFKCGEGAWDEFEEDMNELVAESESP